MQDGVAGRPQPAGLIDTACATRECGFLFNQDGTSSLAHMRLPLRYGLRERKLEGLASAKPLQKVTFSPFLTIAGGMRVNNQGMQSTRDSRSTPLAVGCPRYVSLCKPRRVGNTWYLRSGEYVQAVQSEPMAAADTRTQLLFPKSVTGLQGKR